MREPSESTINPSLASTEPKDLRLEVFEGDPALRYLQRKNVSPRVLLTLPILAVLTLLASSALAGRVSTNGARDALCHDIGRFLFSPDWECLRNAQNSPSFPLARDIGSILCAIILAYTPTLIYRQWLAIRNVFPYMDSLNLISYSEVRKDADVEFRSHVAEANAYFRKRGRLTLLNSSVALACTLGIVVAQRHGIYPRLAPVEYGEAERSAWAEAAYSSWWANFNDSAAGWLAYFALAYLGIYYIVTMNLIGGRVVMLLWQTRHLVSFGADSEDQDGYYGWRKAREVLAPTYTAVALHSLVLVLVVIMVPTRSVWFLLPVMSLWLIAVPPYCLVPIMLARRSIRRFKDDEVAALSQKISALRDQERCQVDPAAERTLLQQREVLHQRLRRIRNIPNLPFRLRDSLVLIVSVFSSTASIYGTIALWYNLS